MEKNIKTAKYQVKINIQEELDRSKGQISNKEPFEHQSRAHQALSKFYKEPGQRGLLILPTGGGKTYTSIYWLLKNIVAEGKKVVWLADQSFLLEQAFKTFREESLLLDPLKKSEVNLRVVSGTPEHCKANSIKQSDDVIFMTAQTAVSNWKSKDTDLEGNQIVESSFEQYIKNNAPNENLFFVYDEAHHTPAYGRRTLLIGDGEDKPGVFSEFPRLSLLGLTATPTHTNEKKKGWLWKIFPGAQPIYEITKKELQDKDILAGENFIPQNTDFSFDLDESELNNIARNHTDVPERIIEELAKNDDRNQFLARHYVDNESDYKKTIIFLDRWYQCQKLEDYLNADCCPGEEKALSVFSMVANSSVDFVNSRAKDQNAINLNRFKDPNDSVNVLINVRMLTEGVDVPDVNTVFITRETNSSILFTQMVGRALRGKKAGGGKDKDVANIVLFSDNWNKHIQFASQTLLGGDTDDTPTKERGYTAFEYISLDLIKAIEFAELEGDVITPGIDFLPLGWYVVEYFEGGESDNLEGYKENVTVNEKQKAAVDQFIKVFNGINIKAFWKNEELDVDLAESEVRSLLDERLDKVTATKLIQIGRHIAQDMTNSHPIYFEFEEREQLDLRKIINIDLESLDLTGLKGRQIRTKEKEFLATLFNSEGRHLLRSVYRSTASFIDVVYREMDVMDNEDADADGVLVMGEHEEQHFDRLAKDELRAVVIAKANNQCACCGSKKRLEIDHVIAVKHHEPTSDHEDCYQALCKTCNGIKAANSRDFKRTQFVEKVIDTKAIKNIRVLETDTPEEYLHRVINCFYGTNAVQKSKTHAIQNGNSKWTVYLQPGIPVEPIDQHLQLLVDSLLEKDFRLKSLEIQEAY